MPYNHPAMLPEVVCLPAEMSDSGN